MVLTRRDPKKITCAWQPLVGVPRSQLRICLSQIMFMFICCRPRESKRQVRLLWPSLWDVRIQVLEEKLSIALLDDLIDGIN
jgi:hypothetical protein